MGGPGQVPGPLHKPGPQGEKERDKEEKVVDLSVLSLSNHSL